MLKFLKARRLEREKRRGTLLDPSDHTNLLARADKDNAKLLDEEWPPLEMGRETKPPRRDVDMELFRQISRALVLKRARKFYSTERQIADKFKVSTTTVSLIRQARSLKHYRQLRREMSKPEQYVNQ